MKKLLAIQSKLKAPKNRMNKFGGYNYRSCEDIFDAVKPLLDAEGCTLTVSDSIELVGDRYYIKATATISDGENEKSVTAYARESLDKKGMDASQITGSASSYARKYALNGLFLIDDTKDFDTEELHNQTQAPAPKAKPQTKAPVKKGVALATPEERQRLIDYCKQYKIDMGWIAEECGIKGELTAPQYAKAMGIVNEIIAQKESGVGD